MGRDAAYKTGVERVAMDNLIGMWEVFILVAVVVLFWVFMRVFFPR